MSQNKRDAEPGEGNPKLHDNIFKWAIASFIDSFFAYFAKGVAVSNIEIIDKEFIKKFEPLKESLKGDLFLAVKVDIDGKSWQIVILIELKSKREDMGKCASTCVMPPCCGMCPFGELPFIQTMQNGEYRFLTGFPSLILPNLSDRKRVKWGKDLRQKGLVKAQ